METKERYYPCGIDGKCDERCEYYYKDHACLNAQRRAYNAVSRDKAYDFFISKGIDVTMHVHGYLLDNRFIFSPTSNKWRSTKRNKWYRSSGPETFYKKYFVK
ncbi:MAG: hypothetical protein JRJ85_08090 [Deltaproteobacteria bacterium]|nr:hypothetical protein [Deltaproteobacteria bacterium]